MANRIVLCCLIMACGLSPVAAQGLDAFKAVDSIKVKANDYRATLVDGEVRGEGDVLITAGDTTVTADKVVVNLKTGEFSAEGSPVKIILTAPDNQNAFEWSGTKVSGNLKTKIFRAGKYYAVFKPWYLSAESTERREDGAIVFKKGKFSSCEQLMDDKAITPWYMRVSEIKIEREERQSADGKIDVVEWITIKHPLLQIYGVPVFYWPWAMFQRDWLENVRIRYGHKEEWGWHVSISYKTTFIKRVWDAMIRAEHYQERGSGVYMENEIEKGDDFNSSIGLYYLNDREPLWDAVIGGNVYNAGNEIPRHRSRLRSFTRWQTHEDVTIRNKIAYMSDPDLAYEFLWKEYDRDPEPNSYLDLSYLKELFEVSVNVNPQVNPFYTTLEKLPEIRFDLPRQQLWDSGLYYQSRNALADLTMRFREYDYGLSPSNADYSAVRFDSTHMFYSPFELGWLNVLPRAGFRFTWYDRSSAGAVSDADLQGLVASNMRRNATGLTPAVQFDEDGDEISRLLMEVGVELNFKMSADWDFRSEWLDMDGVQHTVIPYINYIRIPEEAEGDYNHIYLFDEADRISDVNMIRVGLDQYFRTNRGFGPDRRNELFFRMETYFDYYFDPDAGLEKEGDLGALFELRPASWASFDTQVLYDSHDLDLNSLQSQATFGTRYKISGAYFFQNGYTDRYNYSFGSDLTRPFSTAFYPLTHTESHSVSSTLTVPVGDKNVFSFFIARDLINKETSSREIVWKRKVNCWSFSIALSKTVTEKSVELSLYLTDHPKAQMGYSYDYETVED